MVAMQTRRLNRIAELIHRELSLLLMRAVRDPRLAGVTITGVKVTPDLLLAHVYYSVLGDAEASREAQAGLEHARGFLRSQLAGRLQLRLMPQLLFELDTSAAYGQRIDQLLDQIAREELPGDEL